MDDTALLVVDLQQEFTRRTEAGMPRSNPEAEARVGEMLALFRGRGWPVIHVHHDDPNPASGFRLAIAGGQVMPVAAPQAGEAVFVKTTSGAFASTDLAAHLRAAGIGRLVVVGAAVNYCVASTVRAARDLGIEVVLVSDAVFGFAVRGPDGETHAPEAVLSMTLGTLGSGFARVCHSSEVADILEGVGVAG